MTALFEDNFELYGFDKTKMLDGIWAENDPESTVGNFSLEIPPFEDRGRAWANFGGRGASVRCAWPAGGQNRVGFWGQYYFANLPSTNGFVWPIRFVSGAANAQLGLLLNTDGTLSLHGTRVKTPIATTSVPVIPAATIVDIQMEFDVTTGAVEVRVGTTGNMQTALSIASGAGFGGAPIAGLYIARSGSSTGASTPFLVKSVAAYSLSGTYNNSWPNISGVETVLINEDTAQNNLTPRPRNHFQRPVLRTDSFNGSNRQGLATMSASTEFDFGTGDYTVEGWFRFNELPATADFFSLLSVWDAAGEERTWRLSYKGVGVDGGGLQFEYTTDGTVGTLKRVHDVNWDPQIGIWYHIAVARDSSTKTSRLFINGVEQGTGATDNANYFAGACPFVVGNSFHQRVNQVDVFRFEGHIQDVRITKGVVRYTANFVAPTDFLPSTIGTDPNFTFVSFLSRLDVVGTPPVDLSNNAFQLKLFQSSQVVDYADTTFSFQAAGTDTPFDDRYLESALPKATAVLTVGVNPSDGDTVTLGATTYTFRTVLTAAAGDVLIGADNLESLEHLVAAITGGPGAGSDYAAATLVNASATAENRTPTAGQLTATSILGGVAGNSIVSTETFTDASNVWNTATLTGGADLPGASEFGIESLPPDATGVRWLSVRHRSYAVDGSATVRTNLDVNGSESPNSDNAMTPDVQYYTNRIEEDPETSAALTVSSIENASLKIERIV